MPHIVKKNLNQQIYEDLRREIFEQKIRFGEKLVNRELQKRYGVSSTPVRDAINRLYQDGLLGSLSNGGARVIDFDYNHAREVNEVIAMMNCNAVALSARKGNVAAAARELEDAIARQEEFLDTDRYFEFDQQFHQVFFKYSGNQSFSSLYSQYASLWQLLFRFYYRDQESRRDKSIISHKQIMQLYREGKVEEAVEKMNQHFAGAEQPLGNTLKKTVML